MKLVKFERRLRLEWKKRNLYQNKQDFLIRQCVVIREKKAEEDLPGGSIRFERRRRG